jgi:predicted regulator of Ras-like GTPase activity (Roadblock/LC7/MglB family)
LLKVVTGLAERSDVTDIDASMRHLVDHLVDRVPGVIGALVSSADGFVLASRLPEGPELDPPAVAAMSAAALGLSNRLVQLTGDAPSFMSRHSSTEGQAFVFSIATGVAVLTVLTTTEADPDQLQQVGREIDLGLQRLFRGVSSV